MANPADNNNSNNNNKLLQTFDVIVIGGGFTGLYTARRCVNAGLSVVILERTDHVGGIWASHGNATSSVNSSEPVYRLWDDERKNMIEAQREEEDSNNTPIPKPKKNHPKRDDLLSEMRVLAKTLCVHYGVNVTEILPTMEMDSGGGVFVKCESGVSYQGSHAFICINHQLGEARKWEIPGAPHFRGKIVNGHSDEMRMLFEEKMADTDKVYGRRVLVIGAGAFAVEACETLLRAGASHVTVLCRRYRGTVAPQAFADLGLGRNTLKRETKRQVLETWAELYRESGAVTPECWEEGELTHPEHNVTVSDAWFIGHYYGKLHTVVGTIVSCNETGVILEDGSTIDADVIVKCVGFHPNNGAFQLLGNKFQKCSALGSVHNSITSLCGHRYDSTWVRSIFGQGHAVFVEFVMDMWLKHRDTATWNELNRQRQHDLNNFRVSKDMDIQQTMDPVWSKGLKELNERISSRFDKVTERHMECNRLEWQELVDIIRNKDQLPWSYPGDRFARLLKGDTEVTEVMSTLKWGLGKKTPVPHVCVHNLVENWATNTPDAVALICENDTNVSYRELVERAWVLASRLMSCGVKAGTFVGVCLPHDAALVVSYLAIWKVGAVVFPFAPNTPPKRIQDKLRKCDVWISNIERYDDDPVLKDLKRIHIKSKNGIMELSTFDSFETTTPQWPPCAPDDLALFFETSGSTGKPKGVLVEHQNVVALVQNADWFHYNPSIRHIVHTPVHFDVSTTELWGPLTNGGSCVLCETSNISSKVHLANTVLLTTQLFNMMSTTLEDWGSITTVMIGGEAASPLHVRQWTTANPDKQLLNGYGPTECTTFCVSAYLDTATGDDVPIGRPQSNNDVYVVHVSNEDGDGAGAGAGASATPTLCPPGVEGELWVGGKGVTRGYLENPEDDLNHEKDLNSAFRPNPFGEGRVYRTGDRVVWKNDKMLYFRGRMEGDRQVKVRGHRIELTELEQLLCSIPDVHDAAVVPVYAKTKGSTNLQNSIQHSDSSYKASFDALYSSRSVHLGSFEGWVDSRTLKPYAHDALVEHANQTMEAIAATTPLKHVWEIGCGSGILTERILAQHSLCSYVGTDPSKNVVNMLRTEVNDSRARFEVGDSTTPFSQRLHSDNGTPTPPIDTILINSVIQYLPSEHILLETLRLATDTIQNNNNSGTGTGTIFVGDVRERRLATHHPRRSEDDTELLVDAAWWYHLPLIDPRITNVVVMLKKGTHDTEMNRYRVDVVLDVGKTGKTRVGKLLPEKRTNPRLHSMSSFHNLSLNLNVEAVNASEPSLFPIMDADGDAMTYRVAIGLPTMQLHTSKGIAGIANKESHKLKDKQVPAKSLTVRHLIAFVVPSTVNVDVVLQEMSESIPSAVLPQRIVAMNSLPMNASYKRDTKKLMEMASTMEVLTSSRVTTKADKEEGSALSEAESIMVERWQSILGTQISIHVNDDWFDLGANSLQTMQLSLKIGRGMQWIAAHPTSRQMVAAITLELKSERISSKNTNLSKDPLQTMQYPYEYPFTADHGFEFITLFNYPKRLIMPTVRAVRLLKPSFYRKFIQFVVGSLPLDNPKDGWQIAIRRLLTRYPLLRARFTSKRTLRIEETFQVETYKSSSRAKAELSLVGMFDVPLCRFVYDENNPNGGGGRLFFHHLIFDNGTLHILREAWASQQDDNIVTPVPRKPMPPLKNLRVIKTGLNLDANVHGAYETIFHLQEFKLTSIEAMHLITDVVYAILGTTLSTHKGRKKQSTKYINQFYDERLENDNLVNKIGFHTCTHVLSLPDETRHDGCILDRGLWLNTLHTDFTLREDGRFMDHVEKTMWFPSPATKGIANISPGIFVLLLQYTDVTVLSVHHRASRRTSLKHASHVATSIHNALSRTSY